VITTGDNYVGAAEKQLREKIGDLFSTIGAYYGAPSTTQLENLSMLQATLAAAKKRFEEIQNGQLAKYKAAAEKAGFVFVTLKSFEEFVKKN
jgi:TPP-dependent indolepyruvate ferredoxin oxidoreductase alpha subunit